VVDASARPGPEVVDGLRGCSQVDFAAPMGPANHAEDLGIHEMRRCLFGFSGQPAAHRLGVGPRESDLGQA